MQQIVLIPIFLRYWSATELAAWFAIFAAGNLVLMADAGLHTWSLNRFLSFRALPRGERRMAQYYPAMLTLYGGLGALVILILIISYQFVGFSKILGFSGTPHFDSAFLAMTVGVALILPGNLASAFYRARGLYGRVVGIQCCGMAIGQLGQLAGIITTQSLLVVTLAYVGGQVVTMLYLQYVDMPRKFPLVALRPRRLSGRWIAVQLRRAFPFGVMNVTETALMYAPVLLVSVFVSDRIAVAQWGLTRTVASLLRGLSLQMSLPLAAELGHDYALGMRDKLANLYARGSAILALLVATLTSAAIAFWPDFFAIWTHGTIPYDPSLTLTLLLGTCIAAPSILALSYANYSNRGYLLLWTKSLQLALFIGLSVVLIPRIGPLGAAIALVSSDIIVQFGMMSVIVMKQTLKHAVRHIVFLLGTMAVILSAGIAIGAAIRHIVPMPMGPGRFLVECALWIVAVAIIAAPAAKANVRKLFVAAIPR
jgi:O-antigen/teichoic acid export membrane protein